MLGGRAEGNPASIPGVVVYRPESDPSFIYDPETDQAVDLTTGDRLWVKSPHNDGWGALGLIRASHEPVLLGTFCLHWEMNSNPFVIYDIVRLCRDILEREPVELNYDLGQLASLIKARYDRGRSKSVANVVVVDSRPVRLEPSNQP